MASVLPFDESATPWLATLAVCGFLQQLKNGAVKKI
jgi:hypothetical protein